MVCAKPNYRKWISRKLRCFGGNRKGTAVRYYPLFLDISRRLCVVVGGGNVAERKVERLLACGACVEVVGKRLTPTLAALARGGENRSPRDRL